MSQLDKELWVFRDIFFDESLHLYTDSRGTAYTSVTKFVHRFSPEQDWDAIAAKYAAKHNINMTPAEIRKMWDDNSKAACALGTDVHAYMENLWKRKKFEPIIRRPGYDECIAAGNAAYKDLSNRFAPIREEFIVCKPEWRLCGTIDLLAWDLEKDCLAILDYKTNKEIKRENPWQTCKGALAGLPDCNYVHYSAQLSTYKCLIEARTSFKVGTMALIHISPAGYTYIPCMDYSADILRALERQAEARAE